jgi:REP element-mobilizing transposase RayT
MPRPLRTHAPGTVHHVMIRGVERRTIFSSESDFEDFLVRFAYLVRELGFTVLAWCLIPNHVHFVLRTGDARLAALMARLNSRHAQRFNRITDRVGHLFQDRYQAVLIEDDGGLARCVAYVLGNPVRHRLIAMTALGAFPWSGYGALIGRRRPRSFESAEVVAGALGVERARVADFVRAESLEPAAVGAALEPDQIDELDRLIQHSCRRHGIEMDAVRLRSDGTRAVRHEICARALASLGLPTSQVARHLGIPYRTARKIGSRSQAT